MKSYAKYQSEEVALSLNDMYPVSKTYMIGGIADFDRVEIMAQKLDS